MTEKNTDLTFFTNKEGQNLLDRFKTTSTDTQFFDVLVGYFRSSGFYQLYSSIEPIEKTRILVGLLFKPFACFRIFVTPVIFPCSTMLAVKA